MKSSFLRLLIVVLSLACVPAAGEVHLPAVIGENMVLQQGVELPIWGWAAPGERVTVTIAGQSRCAVAAADDKWMVRMPPMPAGGPHEMTVAASNTITLANVMVGEVWLCSGQSNMYWPVGKCADGAAEAAAANYPNIRLFTANRQTATQPADDLRGRWRICDPNWAADFSAVGYYFGRQLQKELNVPVGLIRSSVGGAGIELWTPRDVLMGDEEVRAVVQNYEEGLARMQAKKVVQYEQALAAWQVEADKANAEGREPPKKPKTPKPPWTASCLYNGMIHPLEPYAIAGVIWYQGESNTERPELYAREFPMMIDSWRRAWGREDLPLLFVQLANYQPRAETPTDSDWARLREAQLKALSVPNTAMAVTIDIGEADNIHPANKQEVGRRLALAALKLAYGRDMVYSGPIFQSMTIDGDKAILSFTHTGAGLTSKGGKLAGFAIAGADRHFVWADARIEADKVVVRSDAVPQPVAVRYAWADNPECNLYNAEGLPASPFRTDDWPMENPTTHPAAGPTARPPSGPSSQ